MPKVSRLLLVCSPRPDSGESLPGALYPGERRAEERCPVRPRGVPAVWCVSCHQNDTAPLLPTSNLFDFTDFTRNTPSPRLSSPWTLDTSLGDLRHRLSVYVYVSSSVVADPVLVEHPCFVGRAPRCTRLRVSSSPAGRLVGTSRARSRASPQTLSITTQSGPLFRRDLDGVDGSVTKICSEFTQFDGTFMN